MRRFISRLERFATVDSTQAVVAVWLAAGVPEVAVAVADAQVHGRGRLGRRWEAPPGSSLLVSCGFRPGWLAPAHGWRLAAVAALAMLDAAEDVAGMRAGTIGLKWPNDLAAQGPDGSLLKWGGVLGDVVLEERPPGVRSFDAPGASRDQSARIATVVVGIGVNVAWSRASFPPELAPSMTSLLELAGGRPVDRDALLEAFLAHLEPRYAALRAGWFDQGGWWTRQLLTNREVEVAVGGTVLVGEAAGVDPETGALLVETGAGPDAGPLPADAGPLPADAGPLPMHAGERRPRIVSIGSGEVTSCRLA